MNSLTIGKKISLACAALVAPTMILGIVAMLNINRMNAELHAIAQGPLPGIYSVGVLTSFAEEQKVSMLEHIASDTPEQKSRAEAEIAQLELKFQAELKAYEKTLDSDESRALLRKLGSAHDRVTDLWAAIQTLSLAGKSKEALGLWTADAIPAELVRATLLRQMSTKRRASGEAEAAAAIKAGDSAGFWAVAILILAGVSGSLLTLVIVRGIDKVLTQTVTAAMTRKNAENSQEAAQVMKSVSLRVADASRTLADMMTFMEEISQSSCKISRIARVIDEIAFETNILALNAAVEAARAGEAGMGFGVVAAEVRNLAQRSAQAARDTASLIENSILKSGEGSSKLREVAGSILSVTQGATQVKTLVAEVEASSREQVQVIEQTSTAVAQMDTVTQRTAANAEESASPSEQLKTQSQSLMSIVVRLQGLVSSVSAPYAPRHPTACGQRPSHRLTVVRARTAVTATTARAAADFPLDDSEYKAF